MPGIGPTPYNGIPYIELPIVLVNGASAVSQRRLMPTASDPWYQVKNTHPVPLCGLRTALFKDAMCVHPTRECAPDTPLASIRAPPGRRYATHSVWLSSTTRVGLLIWWNRPSGTHVRIASNWGVYAVFHVWRSTSGASTNRRVKKNKKKRYTIPAGVSQGQEGRLLQ